MADDEGAIDLEQEIIQCLRHYGAKVNYVDDQGLTALHHAALAGNEVAIRELLVRDKTNNENADIEVPRPPSSFLEGTRRNR